MAKEPEETWAGFSAGNPWLWGWGVRGVAWVARTFAGLSAARLWVQGLDLEDPLCHHKGIGFYSAGSRSC